MKIKRIVGGKVVEEIDRPDGLISRVRYGDLNITTISKMLRGEEEKYRVGSDNETPVLIVNVHRDPSSQEALRIMKEYAGLNLVEFQRGDTRIEITM